VLGCDVGGCTVDCHYVCLPERDDKTMRSMCEKTFERGTKDNH
jgi:hypothetical protein